MFRSLSIRGKEDVVHMNKRRSQWTGVIVIEN